MGVAMLSNRMFIIFNYSNVVHIYTACDGQMMLLDEVHLPSMEWPHDIVACETTGKLFIADMQKLALCLLAKLFCALKISAVRHLSQEMETGHLS